MTEIEPERELSRIAEKIVALVNAHQGEPRAYLVSALGIDLGDDLRLLKTLSDRGLNEFIRSRLAGRVTLVPLGPHRNVFAVVAGAVDPSSVELSPPSREQKPRFQYRFWAAFSVPPERDVRVLNMDDFTFVDLAAGELPGDAVTIDHALIAPADAENRDALIKANIAQWLADRGLMEEQFLAPRRLPRMNGAASSNTGASLLDLVLAALDRKQLQSTNLSLDVVATLLRTPSS